MMAYADVCRMRMAPSDFAVRAAGERKGATLLLALSRTDDYADRTGMRLFF